jgi:hypothetical protein
MFILAPGWSPEVKNSLRYDFVSVDGCVVGRWELMV